MDTQVAASSGIQLTPKGVAYVHRHSREQVEAAVEKLIAALDQMDDDPDLEPEEGVDVSWPEGRPQASGLADTEDVEDDGTDEPSLGSINTGIMSCMTMGFLHIKPSWMTEEDFAASRRADRGYATSYPGSGSQTNWAFGSAGDLEAADGDDEPDVDTEYSLGWREEMDQCLPESDRGNWAIGDGEQNIDDEPHDGELDLQEGDHFEDAEHSLGWSIPTPEGSQGYGALVAGVNGLAGD
jgi:hypothetical protein